MTDQPGPEITPPATPPPPTPGEAPPSVPLTPYTPDGAPSPAPPADAYGSSSFAEPKPAEIAKPLGIEVPQEHSNPQALTENDPTATNTAPGGSTVTIHDWADPKS